MAITHIIILLTTGIGVGFASGLLGVGGAFIMTPVQYLVYTDMGVSTDIAIKLAFGTNLLVVLPTAISGVWRHNKSGVVYWRVAVIMGGSGMATAFAGATLATQLPGEVLKTIFGVVVIAGAVRMLVAGSQEIEEEPRDNPWLLVAWAVPIGLITGIIGIGGGVLVIPVMVLVLKFKIHHAIGTSLAMIILTSIGGLVGYIVNGLGVAGLPPYSLGYVNVLTFSLLAVTSISMAQVGAITAHRLQAKQLRYVFIAIMIYMGLKMLGLFTWLGWPI